MVHYGRSTSCTDAELYYYEYLCGQRDGVVPSAVIDHIRRCAYCQKRIRELESSLGQGGTCAHDAPRAADGVVDTLTRHFAHIGQDVGCTEVKTFLPAMLVASQKIVIPTPITVHLDHCPSCMEDLESLRELELRPEQLARLGKLYGLGRSEDRTTCRRAAPHIPAFVSMAFESIDAEALNHICTCPRCLRRVYERRDRVFAARRPEAFPLSEILCDGISTADLFDWVVPYDRAGTGIGRTPAEDGAALAHVRACPECVERMQALHRAIYGVAQRADSGVSTVYSTGREAKSPAGQAADLYRSYPIRVGVVRRKLQPAVQFWSTARVVAPVRRIVTHPHFRPALRASVAAAVVLLAFGYFFSAQTVSGISVRQLSAAVNAVENLHVARFSGDRTEPTYELWMSRAMGLVVVKSMVEQGVYNLETSERTVRREGVVDRGRLSSEERAGVRQMVSSVFGFASLDNIPVDAELQRVAPGAVEDVEDGCDVYELTWQGRSAGGSAPLYMMRTYLDPGRLPKKTMLYRRVSQEAKREWQLINMSQFDYPARQAVDIAAKQVLGER